MTERIKAKHKSSSALSLAVFIASTQIVLLSIVSIIFPALVGRSTSPIATSQVDVWELGVIAIPLIITNIIMLGIGIAYFTNKFPFKISNAINFIFKFEVSKTVAFLTLVVMLGIYISFTLEELAEEEPWGDFTNVQRKVDNYKIGDVLEGFDLHARYFLLSSSVAIFDNMRVIPFIASISLLVLTYFLTLQISHKRFAGLVATAILLQSPVFWKYDTTATYENFWTVFYVFSLYSIHKFWPLSPISFALSVASKALSAIFLPFTLFFIYQSPISKRKKIAVGLTYIVILLIGILAFTVLGLSLPGAIGEGRQVEFIDRFFWDGFTSFAYQLRFDYLVLLFLLPLTFGLFMASRKGVLQADSILVLIAGILFSAPLLTGFTDITNQPYRFIPLVVFFAIGVGTVLSKRAHEIRKQA